MIVNETVTVLGTIFLLRKTRNIKGLTHFANILNKNVGTIFVKTLIFAQAKFREICQNRRNFEF